MCGIIGISGFVNEVNLQEGIDLLSHRGPDDRGIFIMLDRAMPSRLKSAFPEDTEIQRLGLAETVKEVKNFLGHS